MLRLVLRNLAGTLIRLSEIRAPKMVTKKLMQLDKRFPRFKNKKFLRLIERWFVHAKGSSK